MRYMDHHASIHPKCVWLKRFLLAKFHWKISMLNFLLITRLFWSPITKASLQPSAPPVLHSQLEVVWSWMHTGLAKATAARQVQSTAAFFTRRQTSVARWPQRPPPTHGCTQCSGRAQKVGITIYQWATACALGSTSPLTSVCVCWNLFFKSLVIFSKATA